MAGIMECLLWTVESLNNISDLNLNLIFQSQASSPASKIDFSDGQKNNEEVNNSVMVPFAYF